MALNSGRWISLLELKMLNKNESIFTEYYTFVGKKRLFGERYLFELDTIFISYFIATIQWKTYKKNDIRRVRLYPISAIFCFTALFTANLKKKDIQFIDWHFLYFKLHNYQRPCAATLDLVVSKKKVADIMLNGWEDKDMGCERQVNVFFPVICAINHHNNFLWQRHNLNLLCYVEFEGWVDGGVVKLPRISNVCKKRLDENVDGDERGFSGSKIYKYQPIRQQWIVKMNSQSGAL